MMLAAAAASLVGGAAAADDLTIGVLTETTSLDPHFRNNWANLAMVDHVFDTLMTQGPRAELLSGLVEEATFTDANSVVLKLRKGVKFHDGTPFTAADVLFNVERVKAGIPGATVPMDRYFLQGGKQWTKVDDHTIEIKTSKPYPLLIDDLSLCHIVSAKHGKGLEPKDYNAGKGMIGTGPYKFVEFKQGDRFVVEANPDWWGGKAKWDKVTVRPIASDPTRVAALLGGSVDVINEVPTNDVAQLEKDARVSVFSGPSRRTIMFWPDHSRTRSPYVKDNDGNVLHPNPLLDQRVRRALSLAIDRQAIVDRIMNGQAVPAGQIVFPGGMGHDPSLTPPPYDRQMAKKLLAQAGYPDGFQVVIHTAPNKYGNDVPVSEALAQMWSAVGVKAQVEVIPNASYNSARRKGTVGVPLSSLGSVNTDPGSLVGSLHTFDPSEAFGMANWGRYSNRTLDAVAKELVTATDRNKRIELIQKALRIAWEDEAVWTMYWTETIWAARKGIKVTPRSDQWTLAESMSKE
jgi:peptide/nickel transport system substrate-binding protein